MNDDRLIMARRDPRASRTSSGMPLVNSSSFARLPPLVAPSTQSVEESLRRLAELLSSGSNAGTIGFRIVSGVSTSHWSLHIRRGGSEVVAGPPEHPDMELVLTADTWLEIATGAVSPLEAFTHGRLRVRGDLNLAKQVLREAATSPEAVVDLC